ncbi:MAG: hypothetical protein U5N10_00390 [Gemmobacter sp.]|nr:hypothetical protein [Gemmobacter sp.]
MFMRFSRPKAPPAAAPQALSPELLAEDALAYYVPDTSVKTLRELSAIEQMYGYYTEE